MCSIKSVNLLLINVILTTVVSKIQKSFFLSNISKHNRKCVENYLNIEIFSVWEMKNNLFYCVLSTV